MLNAKMVFFLLKTNPLISNFRLRSKGSENTKVSEVRNSFSKAQIRLASYAQVDILRNAIKLKKRF